MVGQLYKSIKCELIILTKYSIVKYSFIITLMIYAYNVYIVSSIDLDVGISDYYASQMLMVTLIMNVFFVIIIGAILGGSEFSWNTWSIKLSNSSRKNILLAKIICIYLSSVLVSISGFIIGIIFDILRNNTIGISVIILFFQLFVTSLVLMFYGITAFFLSILTKSMLFSATFCISYFFIEQYFNQFISDNISRFLPIYNIKSFLYLLFDQDGAFGFIQPVYNSVGAAILIFIIYVCGVSGLLVYIYNRKQFET